MTFRAPLISRPSQGKKPDSSIARTFVSAGLALLVGASAFNPLPEVLVSRAANKRLVTPQTITANLVPLNSIAVVALPIGKTADRDPPKQKRRTYIDHSWIERNDLCRQLAVTLPKQITDWPLASRLKVINRDGQLQNVAALNTVVVSTKPFSLLDWQLPKKWRSDPPNVTYSESLALTVAKPFLNTDWPLSLRRKAATPDPATLNIAATRTVVVATKPFAQLDWSLPRIGKDNKQARITPLRDPSIFDVTPVITLNLAATEKPDTALFSLAFWRPKPVNPDIWTPIPFHGSSLGTILTEDHLAIITEDGTSILLNALTTSPMVTEYVLDIDTEGGEPILVTMDDPGGGDLLWTPKGIGSSIWRKV